MADEGIERMFIALSNSITKLGDDVNLELLLKPSKEFWKRPRNVSCAV